MEAQLVGHCGQDFKTECPATSISYMNSDSCKCEKSTWFVKGSLQISKLERQLVQICLFDFFCRKEYLFFEFLNIKNVFCGVGVEWHRPPQDRQTALLHQCHLSQKFVHQPWWAPERMAYYSNHSIITCSPMYIIYIYICGRDLLV